MFSKLMWQMALCVFSCLACTAQAQEPTSAEEIIAKHIEAIGGRAALDACKTMRITGKTNRSDGREADFVGEVKQPDKFRIETKPARSERTLLASDGQPDERFAMPKPKAIAEEEAIAEEDEPIPVIENDPAGRALYDGMIAAMRAADTLSFKSQFRMTTRQPQFDMRSTYHMWLKKPNHFRTEGFLFGQDEPSGILVGDGDHLWIYWPKGCPFLRAEQRSEYDQGGKNAYLTRPTPQGQHSITHEMTRLASLPFKPILNASTFHGYTDSLQPYLEAVARRGVEPFGGEECDVIEVSLMKGQRTWKIWVARRDRMPRKLVETVRVANTVEWEEIWTDVKVNEAIPDDKFVWQPPEGWKEWSPPKDEERLLKPRTEAPDFKLLSTEGKPIKLSDYRGQIVCFYIWRAG